jgi:hypothetical protein
MYIRVVEKKRQCNFIERGIMYRNELTAFYKQIQNEDMNIIVHLYKQVYKGNAHLHMKTKYT